METIKKRWSDCALTLSVGERDRGVYQSFFDAGADRYLLRHETANEAHYHRLHPAALSLARRKECLWTLKEIGFQVGAGFMVGAPGQTAETLAEDLIFLQQLQPHMVGIGPFLPHKDTPFAQEAAGSTEQTLLLLSCVRLMLPQVLLPATTALGTAAADGRERGILAGANVVMPNLSPPFPSAKNTCFTTTKSALATNRRNADPACSTGSPPSAMNGRWNEATALARLSAHLCQHCPCTERITPALQCAFSGLKETKEKEFMCYVRSEIPPR